jgi:hypothetical protein
MVYTFPMKDQDGRPIMVDTESEETKRRVAWVADMAGLPLPTLRESLNVSPGATPDGQISPTASLVMFAQYEFVKDDRVAPVSVFAFDDTGLPATEMPGVLSYLNIELGLGLDIDAIRGMRYRPPAPPEPQQDWQAPDSPMSEPLPAQPGRFKSRSTGKPLGYVWKGPSGTSYKLMNIGGIFQYLAWVQQ